MTWSIVKPLGALIWRCSAETTPVVSVRSRPNGLPIATVGSPTCRPLDVPSCSGCRSTPLGSIFSSARSVDLSTPSDLAPRGVAPSPKRTLTFVAPSTTCALVAIVPSLSRTKPGAGRDALLLLRDAEVERAAGRALHDLGGDVRDAGRVALVDVARGQDAAGVLARVRGGERRLLDDGRGLVAAADVQHGHRAGHEAAADDAADEGYGKNRAGSLHRWGQASTRGISNSITGPKTS